MGPPESPKSHPKIKRVGGSDCPAGREHASVCSKGASSSFIRGKRANAIAARAAGRRHGSGRGGRRSNDTGRRRRANRNGTAKADATGNSSKAGNHHSQKQLTKAARVITKKDLFSIIRAIGLAAMRYSCASGEVLCSASVRMRAGVRWSGSKSWSGAGRGRALLPAFIVTFLPLPSDESLVI
jgi:hypothetical protein